MRMQEMLAQAERDMGAHGYCWALLSVKGGPGKEHALKPFRRRAHEAAETAEVLLTVLATEEKVEKKVAS